MWTLLGGPDWMPITPNRGSFLHADSHAGDDLLWDGIGFESAQGSRRVDGVKQSYLRHREPHSVFEAKNFSRGHPIFLVLAAHHDLERIIGQWPLQRLRLIPRRAHPDIALFVGDQD